MDKGLLWPDVPNRPKEAQLILITYTIYCKDEEVAKKVQERVSLDDLMLIGGVVEVGAGFQAGIRRQDDTTQDA